MHPIDHGWDTSDLKRRLCHALDIAQQAVERLASTGYSDPEEPANLIRGEKVIAETALFLYASSTARGHDAIKARIHDIATLLIPHARSDRVRLAICLQPALVWDYAQAHVLLGRLGFPDAGFDQLLKQTIKSEACLGRERTPHRMLEQDWIFDVWSQSPAPRRQRSRATAIHSILNHPMDLWSGSREDVYAFTHALMYLRDFNISPRRLPRANEAILTEAESALARCLDQEDYDLGGEVLLTWPLTGTYWSAAAAFGFRVLATVEDKAGFLPSPTTRLERLNRLHGSDRTDYLLATAYHTAYVMGLLCTTALQPGRLPPSSIPIEGARRGTAREVLPFLKSNSREPHWLNEFKILNELQQDALSSFLFAVALRRQIRDRDFASVYRLLEIGNYHGLSSVPIAGQAAELLERLSTVLNRHGNQ